MFHHLAAIPFAMTVFFYVWALTMSHGANVVGFHLALLSVSFFYLCTPLPSLLFLLGLLPGSLKGRRLFPLYLWMFFLLFNVVSLAYMPGLYSQILTTSILQHIFGNTRLMLFVFSMSGGALLFQWSAGHLKHPLARISLYLLGLSFSALVFFMLYWLHLNKVVGVLNAGGMNY